jgi:hypothetical protein
MGGTYVIFKAYITTVQIILDSIRIIFLFVPKVVLALLLSMTGAHVSCSLSAPIFWLSPLSTANAFPPCFESVHPVVNFLLAHAIIIP